MANLALRRLLSPNGNIFEPGLSLINLLEALESHVIPVDENWMVLICIHLWNIPAFCPLFRMGDIHPLFLFYFYFIVGTLLWVITARLVWSEFLCFSCILICAPPVVMSLALMYFSTSGNPLLLVRYACTLMEGNCMIITTLSRPPQNRNCQLFLPVYFSLPCILLRRLVIVTVFGGCSSMLLY